ncbi:epimerase [Nonomuraea aridisoli]|uniref:Epimerase n=1 Tax=Nonomuraea aridisoli TaxID=2070368 RepID=A0A2W2ERG9_9ACTN|nr:epimerase [Nonomuraea aridisoli]PZG19379.1 epimerase [Nonomuraea aridisoli]
MRVILFGATGVIGRAVLRECLLDDRVTGVLVVGRVPEGFVHPKLRTGEPVGYDACFCCAPGLALPAARTLAPGCTLVYVRGAAETDAAQEAVLALPLEAYVFRPGRLPSGRPPFRLAYVVTRPLLPLLRRWWGGEATTPERIGRAMITVAERGAPRRVLGPADINVLAEGS